MTSRPNPANKLAEMSRQQALIEQKRREIEERRRAAGGPPAASLSAGSSARRLFEAHKQSFRPTLKKPVSTEQPSPAPSPSPANAFENDGSFMEMFQRMQKAHAAAVPPSPADRPSVSSAARPPPPPPPPAGSIGAPRGCQEAAAGPSGVGGDGRQSGLDHEATASDGVGDSGARKRRRGSRWGSEDDKGQVPPVGLAAPTVAFPTALANKTPELVAYAKRVFGNVDQMSDAQWKQCEDQLKMNVLLEDIQKKKAQAERLAAKGKVKYEYDSDEETEGGTWEHKRRKAEMIETHSKAEELTKMNEGKHHIGDFLPPDELERFMEKWRALKEDREPDMSDYREFRLKEDNMGFQMLKKMGWTEGSGLGSDGGGITAPVSQRRTLDTAGVGAGAQADVSKEDDEFDAYRKRMMLAYKFRPNPLNNPRRAYY